MISFDITAAGIGEAELGRFCAERALPALALLRDGSGEGGEFSKWFRLPDDTGATADIKAEARRITDMSEVLVVVGVGGSRLGAQALTELLTPEFHAARLIFAGKDLSARRTAELLEYLAGRDFSVNVISKSGTTTEPAVIFRLLLGLLERKYGDRAAERVTVTTDTEKGALLEMSRTHGWRRFAVPEGVGGRYSVLTPAGLLPAAAAGIDPDELLAGALGEKLRMLRLGAESPELRYASARRMLYAEGRRTELLSFWEPSMRGFGEWYKQLFGESEGKEGRGIFPASLEMPSDLHSMGQYIQQGPRDMMETMLSVSGGAPHIRLPERRGEADGLDYLAGTELSEIEQTVRAAVVRAHADGGVPVMQASLDKLDAGNAGAMIWFFETACAVSAYMDGVNPFDQPGVEAYKRNMYRLLGRPGF